MEGWMNDDGWSMDVLMRSIGTDKWMDEHTDG